MSATTYQKSSGVLRGGPHPVSGPPYVITRRLGEERRLLHGKTVLEHCAGSTTGEIRISHPDSRLSPPEFPGSTSGDDGERWATLSTDPLSTGFIFIHYLFVPKPPLTM